MRDVALRAGVSLKTVSRVINEEPGVAAATAERVTVAIAELGFQRNDLARSLRQGRTSSTLGLVIEDVANPFYSAIAQAVESAASARGFMLITASCEEDPGRERELVQALLRRRVDALLLVPASRDHAYLARETADGTPVVFLDRPPAGLDAAGVPVRHELVRPGTRDVAGAERVVGELLALPPDRRPTAIFAGNNRLTVGALRALRAADREVALVGFDDFELADLLGITVVRHDSPQMGAQAAALAFERLDGGARPPRRVVVPTALVPRGSGEIPPS
jgi:LacI family transcriptional regulator